LRLVGHKSRRDDDLPLPSTVAVAIVTYLREPRPDNAGRHVFLRIRPPIGSGVTRRIVCNVIRLAGVRAGMRDLIAGPLVLRHTAATRMLRHGASIKDIADVLRHRSLDTTAIYTKVDLPRLATVAAPWPQEGGR
jgi:integrase/recombinase XerD